MSKMSYAEMASIFYRREAENKSLPYDEQRHLTGCIVFTEDSFTKQYSLESRTYCVSSNNKAYIPNMCGYSIYGSALDGSDDGVRLEAYMAAEKGGADGWKVDYCYLVDDDGKEIDA